MLKNSGTQYLDNNMTEIVPYNTDLISSIKVSIMLRHGTLCNTQSTPEPRPLKKGTFDSNTAINSEGSGDMSSTQYNQI